MLKPKQTEKLYGMRRVRYLLMLTLTKTKLNEEQRFLILFRNSCAN